jgi:hypothetical protein
MGNQCTELLDQYQPEKMRNVPKDHPMEYPNANRSFRESGIMRGGARKGAGRKATGPRTILMTFSLNPETALLLTGIERGKRSGFIDMAIREAIERIN